MIDLTPTITQGQIAFALVIIAFALVWRVFGEEPTKSRKRK